MKKDPDLDKIHEANLYVAIIERSGGISEVTGRPVRLEDERQFFSKREPAWPRGVIHHILGRGYPEGYKDAPPEVKEVWPHCEVGCILLTIGEHYTGHGRSETVKSPRIMKHLLLAWILFRYGDRIWNGRTYREWLNEPPFKEWM